MDIENLKEAYKNSALENTKSISSLSKMKLAKHHPVLKKIRRQLIFESIIWTLILIVFYDFFDGHLKSMFWNVLLALTIIFLLCHNILGYLAVKQPIEDNNIKKSLKKYLAKIKHYSTISILSRIVTFVIFMLYLTSNIKWDTYKLWSSICFFGLLIMVQVYVLRKVWKDRIIRIDTIHQQILRFHP